MPRIDPIQLLNCLSVLLSPFGGIKSRDEVQRLANLMTKFSKKLVSKCIYIQILKCTETELLSLFMGSGGWSLIHMWLTESIVTKNWPLVRELLELLLLCPVDIERLKTNNCPKLVKELSKDDNHYAIRALASKVVEQWLKTVKGEHVAPIKITDVALIIADAEAEYRKSELIVKVERSFDSECVEKLSNDVDNELKPNIEDNKLPVSIETTAIQIDDGKNQEKKDVTVKEEPGIEPEVLPVLKISLKDGKQVVSKVDEESEVKSLDKSLEKSLEKDKAKDKHKHKSSRSSKSSISDSPKSSSSKSSSKSHSSSDKHTSNDKHKSNSENNSPSRHSSKDKIKEKSRHKSHSSKHKEIETSSRKSEKSSSSSNKSKDDRNIRGSDKDKAKEKDKIKESTIKPPIDKVENKIEPPSIQKLGKIPKLSDVKKDKPSISIEVRKPDEPKPKTVKTFNSKFRKHGLEEEIKPPPSRATVLNKKVIPVVPPPVVIPKRPSPVHNETPPEKKPKTTEHIEKPGSIKLIKAKPMMLLESDMFMDALNASATTKKEPKKRKRRTSGSKDGSAPNDSSPPHTPTAESSPVENKSVPPKFYQDTLDTDEDRDKPSGKKSPDTEKVADVKNIVKEKEEVMDIEPHTITVNGLKGVLCYHKRKGPKKSIKWKPDSELEEIQYFELDETERVNVTKTFTDMKYLERIHEREAFQKARNLSVDDVMEEKTGWKPLVLIDTEGQIQVEYGKNSKEKDIQAIRQKATLQPLYFHKSMIPDSPLEPELETHTYAEPVSIPLEDATGNQDNISDFRNMPWPEPKGDAPPPSNNVNVPSLFHNQFPNGFPPTQFPGVPGFQGPNMLPSDWPNGIPPHIMANGIPMPMPPAGLAPGSMPPGSMPPPGLLVPPENLMMGPDMFGVPNPMFSVPPEGFNMQQTMFPPDFNMSRPPVPPGPQGPDGFTSPDNFPGPDGFSNHGHSNFRGPMRGRGSNNHWRGKNSGNWDGAQRGRGGSRGGRKAVCIYFQRKGSCRQGDNCTFLHPGVNCPY